VVDQNQDDVLGQSPLHLAVWRPQHLQFMLQAGFDVNARDWNGRTPLMYAAAAGMTETAISLVRAGADIWIQDNLYRKHRWFHYAVLSSHWQLVLDVIDIIRQSLRFSPNEVQTLLDSTIKLWANETDGVVGIKKSEHFTSLLNWGADPEVRFSAKWLVYKASSNTLLHCITTCTDFNTLLSSGFTSFNYPNSTGCNALMTQLEAGNPELIQKSITSGCNIDQQDNRGRTALHVCAEIIRSTIMSINARDSDFRFQILKCTGVLMCSDANPFLGDCCRCACSTSGCTPSNMLLKDFNQKIRDIPHRSYPLTMHSWVNHWFRLLKKVEKDFEHSRPFFLEIIRLSKFEQLKLTHTCCRFVDHGDRHWITLDEEDVVEILEEEEELSAVLEQEMGALERCSIPELEALWLGETDRLMQIQSENFQDISTSVINLAVDI
jgi:ankyrin repeat protein